MNRRSNADLLEIYRYLAAGRCMAQSFGEARPDWHSAEGEEAVVAGTFYGLRPDDVVSPHYRGCELVSYMRGSSFLEIYLSILGKAAGESHGRHKNEFCGSFRQNIIGLYSGVLGPNISYGAGAALMMKLRKNDNVAAISFGDGTANRGEFHETLRTCAMLKLPAVFVCQNNQYAISMSSAEAFNNASLAKFGPAYGVPARQVDGMDALEVHEAVLEAVELARGGGGPSLIEAMTCRFTGHWISDKEDYRPAGEASHMRSRDPLTVMEQHIVSSGAADRRELSSILETARLQVSEAANTAKNAPAPDTGHLGKDEVYA